MNHIYCVPVLRKPERRYFGANRYAIDCHRIEILPKLICLKRRKGSVRGEKLAKRLGFLTVGGLRRFVARVAGMSLAEYIAKQTGESK